MKLSEIIAPGEACRELGISTRTLLRLVDSGLLEPVIRTPGGHARFTRASIKLFKEIPRSALRALKAKNVAAERASAGNPDDPPQAVANEPRRTSQREVAPTLCNELHLASRRSSGPANCADSAVIEHGHMAPINRADDGFSMSPDAVFWEFGISPYILAQWTKRGLLSPLREAVQGRSRYDRQAVETVRQSEQYPTLQFLPFKPKPKPKRQNVVQTRQFTTMLAEFRRGGKVGGLGVLELPARVAAAKQEGLPIDALLDDALFALIGVSRAALADELARRRSSTVAKQLGVSKRRLGEICTLYEVVPSKNESNADQKGLETEIQSEESTYFGNENQQDIQ